MANAEEKGKISGDVFESLTKHFVGNNNRYRENIVIPKNFGPVKIKTNEEKMVEAAFESCAFKSMMSCVIGECCRTFDEPTRTYAVARVRVRPGRRHRPVLREHGPHGDGNRAANRQAGLQGDEEHHARLRQELRHDRGAVFGRGVHDRERNAPLVVYLREVTVFACRRGGRAIGGTGRTPAA